MTTPPVPSDAVLDTAQFPFADAGLVTPQREDDSTILVDTWEEDEGEWDGWDGTWVEQDLATWGQKPRPVKKPKNYKPVPKKKQCNSQIKICH